MRKNRFLTTAALTSGLAVSALACSVAHAEPPQETPAPGPEAQQPAAAAAAAPADNAATPITEVVVTALSRRQRLQNTPVAINVLSGEQLREKGAVGFQDYLATVPGVNFSQSNLGASRVTILGISDGLGASDPLAAIYIDDLPITEGFGPTFDPAIYDMERVEVLKGPQGTLYGAGSMGGTVRVVGKKPKLDVREFVVDGGVGGTAHGGTNKRADAVMNIPLVDELMALRVSVGSRDESGWIDDVLRGESNGNTLKKQNLRAQLMLRPSTDTSIILGYMYQKDEAGLPWYEDANRGEYQTGRVFRAWNDAKASATTLTIQHDWEAMSLTSASNYLSKDNVRGDDSSGSLRPLVARLAGVTLGPSEGIGLQNNSRFNIFTQEVRLTSAGRNRFDWVLGAYYSNATTDYRQVFDFNQAPTVSSVVSGSAFYSSRQEYTTRQTAGFGELTYNVNDKLSFTAGLRAFDVEQRNLTDSSGRLNGGSSVTSLAGGDASHTQKYLVKYQATRDHMLFASATQGYRNGGPTGNAPLAACGADAAALGYATIPNSYKADTLWNYEIGSKNALMGGKLRLNASAFYADWKDIQSSIAMACGFTFVANAGKAVSKGAEFELVVQPATGLTMTGSLSFIDARITDAAAGTNARDGDRLPLTSKWSGGLSAQYERPFAGGYVGFAGGDVNYVGERWNAFQGARNAALLGDYTLANLRFGVRKDNWSLSAFVNNLLDEHYQTMTQPTGTPAYSTIGRPRTVGLNARLAF